jgi:hypothetical protein
VEASYTILTVPSGWQSFGCGGGGRWQFLGDGSTAIEGEDTPTTAWPVHDRYHPTIIDDWMDEIADSALRHGVPAAWIAAVMGVESGGNNVGSGLMQVLPGTASSIEGRKITSADMIADPALSIDLGTKYFRGHLDGKYAGKNSQPVGGDPVKASVAYNAGGVRCGTGRTEALPKEPCPTSGWNVIIGCARNARKVTPECIPSTVVEGQFVCSSDYPRRFMQYLNVALSRGWGEMPPGYEGLLLSKTEPMDNLPAPIGSWLLALAVGASCYAGVRYGLPRVVRLGVRARLW